MGHDLAATRRVRKGLLTTPGGAEARAAGPDPRPPDAALVPPVIADTVVADVRHEVGNYLHKLYYWADFLTESRTGRAADVTATQMLDETIRGLEELLRVTLEYVRPIGATPMALGAREVADGVVRQLASTLGTRTLRTAVRGDTDGWQVALDPGRFSQLLAAIGRRVDASTAADAALDLEVTIDARDGAPELRASLAGVGEPTGSATVREVEWATAENLARLVGGRLVLTSVDERRALVLTVPLRR
jgi:hypothetical protein